MTTFNYNLNFKEINFRLQPQLYHVGKGEQGVLLVEPYKSEILRHWKFKTPEIAAASSGTIYELYLDYKKSGDFIGMDMCRKFLQMGYTRSRRYANHKGGKKYDGPVPEDKKGQSGAHGRNILPRVEDRVKAESARIFYEKWQQVKNDEEYLAMVQEHKTKFEGSTK